MMDDVSVFYKVFKITKEKQAEIDLKILRWMNENKRLPEIIEELMNIDDKRELIATAFRLGYLHLLDHIDDPLTPVAFQQLNFLKMISTALDDDTLFQVLLHTIEKGEKSLKHRKESINQDVF